MESLKDAVSNESNIDDDKRIVGHNPDVSNKEKDSSTEGHNPDVSNKEKDSSTGDLYNYQHIQLMINNTGQKVMKFEGDNSADLSTKEDRLILGHNPDVSNKEKDYSTGGNRSAYPGIEKDYPTGGGNWNDSKTDKEPTAKEPHDIIDAPCQCTDCCNLERRTVWCCLCCLTRKIRDERDYKELTK